MLNFQTPVIRGLFLFTASKFIGATVSRQQVEHIGPTTPKDASKQNARKLN